MSFRVNVVLLSCVLVTACGTRGGGGYYEDDGPPDSKRLDVAKVADPIPRYEPRSNRGNDPYKALGRWYHPLQSARGYSERGAASWYGKKFHGRRTSSGEKYDMFAMTAAHRTLPLPTYVRVVNLKNGRTAIVKVNDRGPFLHNRLIDLSYAAAYKLGIIGTGTGLVEVTAVFPDSQSAHATTPVARAPVISRQPRVFLQLGAFADQDNALRMQEQLAKQGYSPGLEQVSKNGLVLYRVRIGPLSGVEAADLTSARLRAVGFEPQLIVD